MAPVHTVARFVLILHPLLKIFAYVNMLTKEDVVFEHENVKKNLSDDTDATVKK